MPKLIRTSNSDTFLAEVGEAKWRFPCTLFPYFAAMFLVLRNHDYFDDCVARVCRRVNRSMNPLDDCAERVNRSINPLVRDADAFLFFESIEGDNNISHAQYVRIFIKSDMLSRGCKAGIRFIVRCPAS